ncbi:PREDICTED: leucine-rich repeat and calponin homology domain-containing protein 3-like isoform X2 [Priapulus caudatus]|uniref:Leucine-rich repeat and calponin homology domain-containing protein 3-like isoform X2 n=1 Tax=Priapulus caudatus TaxID=37621 RepID=A0ABM1DX86_PRICU|nr:PREDICTED: leucine-rich repeat and calponin homology domain-containing protein 3-like isoform X2 [Priapulus caudatus]
MATTVTGGPQLTRSIERVLEDAQHTGILNITGRKLKEFPKAAAKYDLSDTVLADLSKNRLSEIPEVVCEYWSLESMTCYCNNIRVIPDAVTNLQYLTRLNLSRNQLATLPASLCMLPSLQVLIVSNNKLVSLPEEIGHLTTLMDLDVSCNEISHLPLQLCDIESLAVLNLRKNFLIDLPKDLTRLKLVKLNISENRISQLHPSLIKLMDTLVELVVENNPLISPPALVCNRGRVHIFKCLEIVAVKEAKRHGILTDQDLKQVFRKSRSAQPLSEDYSRPRQSSEEKRQRNLVASIADSGYITTDSNEDKRWSNESADTNASIEDSRNLALRAMEATKEHWQERGRQQQQQQPPYDASARSRQAIGEQTPIHLVASSPALLDTDERQDEFTKELSRQKAMYEERKKIAEKIKQTIASKSTPPDTPNPPETNGEDPFSKELARQKLLYEEKKQSAEKIRRERAREEEDEREERRRAAVRLQKEQEALIDRQRDEAKRKAEGSSTVAAASPSKTANGTAPVEIRTLKTTTLKRSGSPHFMSPWINAVNQEKTTASLVRGSPSRQQQQQQHRVANSRSPVPICTKQLTPVSRHTSNAHRDSDVDSMFSTDSGACDEFMSEEEFRQKREALVNQTRQQAMLAQRRLEEQRVRMKQIQKDAVLNYVRRTSTSGSPEKELAPSPSPERGFSPQQQLAATMPDSPQQSNLPKSRPAFTPPSTMRAVDGAEPSFTIRRRLDHRDEKQRQMEQLRHNIESRLKVTLPGDLSAALLDGVVLCHLANHIRPRSVQSIHVPSPAVPKLSLAKCRRNVENFVEACRRIGVDEGLLCACDDVVEELSMLRVARTVNALARRPHNITTRDRVLSYVLMLVFLIVCYMLGFHPPG